MKSKSGKNKEVSHEVKSKSNTKGDKFNNNVSNKTENKGIKRKYLNENYRVEKSKTVVLEIDKKEAAKKHCSESLLYIQKLLTHAKIEYNYFKSANCNYDWKSEVICDKISDKLNKRLQHLASSQNIESIKLICQIEKLSCSISITD